MEMDFARYAGQLRPPTWRDMDLVAELERELIAELYRALIWDVENLSDAQ
jgi:hypothetical protein